MRHVLKLTTYVNNEIANILTGNMCENNEVTIFTQ